MAVSTQELEFGPFRAEAATHRLILDGVETELRPQAFLVLKALAENSGRYVDYEQMIREAWNGNLVSKHTVAVTVGEVKRAFGEHAAWISYRPKLGYRLDVPRSEDVIKRGWHFWYHHTREGFEKALRCFRQAAQDDPGDYRAYEGISSTHLMLATYGMRPPREMYKGFIEAHNRAVALRGLTPELRADRAHGLHVFERKLRDAETELLQARKEKPKLAAAQVRLAILYATSGRSNEALDVLAETSPSDSLCPLLASTEIIVRIWNRDLDAAVECGKKALELHPYHLLCRFFAALALECAGQVAEALSEYHLASIIAPDLLWLRVMEARCLAKLGQETEASVLCGELLRIRKTEYLDGYHFATLYADMGMREEAMQELERAVQEGSCMLHVLDVDPKLDALRADPRFALIRQRVFTSPFQRAQAS
jgi:DNA-binding winged helix-turn-helix (wHTH) protein